MVSNHPGFVEAVGVVAGALDRVRDPRQLAVEVRGDLDVAAGGLVLTGVQAGLGRPGPARRQGSVHDVLRAGVQVIGGRHVLLERLPDERGECADGAADRRLGHPERFGKLVLDPVPAQIRQVHHNGFEQSENWWPRPFRFRCCGVNHHGQILNVVTSKSCGMVHVRRSVSESTEFDNPILSRSGRCLWRHADVDQVKLPP